jgi:tight adherence protein B
VLIFLIAAGVGIVSWLILFLLDRNKLRKSVQPDSIPPPLNQWNGLAAAETIESSLVHYSEYAMSRKEKLTAILMLGMPMAFIGYIFYQNIVLALAVSLLGLAFPQIRRKQLIEQRKNKLNTQFKQALSCLSSSLAAGKSVESSFKDAWTDLKVLYPDPACYIVVEFQVLLRRLDNGEPIEAGILDFAQRSGLEDVCSFADVFITCKRTGGNLIEVMKRTSGIISDKLEIKQDISVMIAQKKFESRVLLFAPIIIVAVLSFSSPEYMEPLYTGIGIGIMSVCLLVLVGCFWLTQKIMNIKV